MQLELELNHCRLGHIGSLAAAPGTHALNSSTACGTVRWNGTAAAPLTAFFSLDAMSLLMDAWHTSAQQPAHVLYSLTARMDFVMLDAGISCLHSIAVGCAAVPAPAAG